VFSELNAPLDHQQQTRISCASSLTRPVCVAEHPVNLMLLLATLTSMQKRGVTRLTRQVVDTDALHCAYGGIKSSLSGAVSPTVSQTISTEGVNISATGTCFDNAGNSASNTQGGIKIDKTAPSLSLKPFLTPFPNDHKYRSFRMADMVTTA